MEARTALLLTLAVISGAITATIAYKKGELFWPWLLVGAVLPLFGVVWVLCMRADPRTLAAREIKAGRAKVCPWCASLIPIEASVCPRCRQWVVQPPAYPPQYPPPR
jgi:hypothetical protein